MNRLLAIICAAALTAGMLVSSSGWAISVVEFLQLKTSEQMALMRPISLGFLKAGYKGVPDNEYTLCEAVKKLAFQKGYVYQNLDEVAKEAAISLGMVRAF